MSSGALKQIPFMDAKECPRDWWVKGAGPPHRRILVNKSDTAAVVLKRLTEKEVSQLVSSAVLNRFEERRLQWLSNPEVLFGTKAVPRDVAGFRNSLKVGRLLELLDVRITSAAICDPGTQTAVLGLLQSLHLDDLPSVMVEARLPREALQRLSALPFDDFLAELASRKASSLVGYGGVCNELIVRLSSRRIVLFGDLLDTLNLQYSSFNSNNLRKWCDGAFDVGMIEANKTTVDGFAARWGPSILFKTSACHAEDLSQDLLDACFNTRRILDPRLTEAQRQLDGYLIANRSKFSIGAVPELRIRSAVTLAKEKRFHHRSRLNKLNGTFLWAAAANPALVAWTDAFRDYVAIQEQISGLQSASRRFNPILEWLLQLPPERMAQLPSPKQLHRVRDIRPDHESLSGPVRLRHFDHLVPYVKSKAEGLSSGIKQANQSLTAFKEFLSWYGAKNSLPELKLILRDEDWTRDATVIIKTVRDAMPPQFQNRAREILTDDDYAWAKRIREDWFPAIKGMEIRPGDTVRMEKDVAFIWSPCRAVALETLLTLPIRVDSLQSADSGAADELVWSLERNLFTRNESPLAQKKRRLGVFREYSDRDASIVGFYFTNNKTRPDGAEVKWDNAELRAKIYHVIQFELHYFGEPQPIHRDDVAGGKRTTQAARRRYPIYYPAFRDFANPWKGTSKCISSLRIRTLWANLLLELEKQHQEKVRQGLEQPIAPVVVTRDKKGVPQQLRWDLHSLRVSGITALAMAGLPVAVIAEFLAGHASIVMDLYYVKLGVSAVNSMISGAMDKIRRDPDLTGLQNFYQDEQVLRAMLASNVHPDAIDAASQFEPALWHYNRGFVCPNGGTLCHEGSVQAHKIGGTRYEHSMVEGGVGNCPMCRFSLCGPMTLDDQALAANALMYEIGDLADTRKRVQNEMTKAIEANDTALVRRLRSDLQAKEQQLESAMRTWAARMEFIRQSVNAQYDSASSQSPNSEGPGTWLTLGNDDAMEYSLKHTKDRRTHLMVAVALAGNVATVHRVASAELRLISMLDRALHDNGMQSFLFALPEDQAARAAAELARRVGHALESGAGGIPPRLIEFLEGRLAFQSLPQSDVTKIQSAVASAASTNWSSTDGVAKIGTRNLSASSKSGTGDEDAKAQ